jgi:hypothetical protein
MAPGRIAPTDLDETRDYLVDMPEGPVGVVDGLGRDTRGRPRSLVVAQGWFGRTRLEVPIEKVANVDHGSRRVVLKSGAAPLEGAGSLR